MNTFDLLMYASSHDMIDLGRVQEQFNMETRKELLQKHPYKIWEGKNGKWYTYIKVGEERKLKKRLTQTAIEDLVLDSLEYSIADIFKEWNDWRLECGKITAASHKRYKNIFVKYFDEFGEVKIKSLEPEQLIEHLERQQAMHDISAKEFSNLKTIVKGTMKRAKRKRLIDWSIEEAYYDLDISDRCFRRSKSKKNEVFTDEEWVKLIGYLVTHQDLMNLGLLLLCVTGMRVGELAALKACDVDEDGTIFVSRTESCYLNNGRYSYCVQEFTKTDAGMRVIVIPGEFLWLSKKLKQMAGNAYIFEKSGERVKEQAFRRRLTRVCKNAGIEPKSPHKIRKTYGSILLDANLDRRFILDQMGHADISVTENHYHRNRKSIEKKRDILDSLSDFQFR